jgi:hypothetical protein
MERRNQLRKECEQTKRVLNFPFGIAERQRQVERRTAILIEARAPAASLSVTGEHWFNAEESSH